MGILSYIFAKDNPAKLLELYKKSLNANEKQKIVNRLIELNAANELWQIKGNSIYSQQIYDFLFKYYSSDNAKILELYRNGDNDVRSKALIQLIGNHAMIDLWDIKDDHPNKIYPVLISHYTEDNKQLKYLFYDISRSTFNRSTLIEDIVQKLINNKANDELWEIKDDYPTKIYPVLISHYSKDNKRLKELFYNALHDIWKEDIVQKLINNNAIDELWQIRDINSKVIYPVLITHYSKNNSKLKELLDGANTQFKKASIEKLIHNKANHELWGIKTNYPDLIYPYFLGLYTKENNKLLELYKSANADNKEKIVGILMENDANIELWEIKDDFAGQIYPFLIKRLNNPEKLLALLDKNKNYQSQIIDCLIELKATKELWQIKDADSFKTVPYLLGVYSNDNQKLLELHKTANQNQKKQVVDIMINNGANSELWQIKDSFPDKIYSYFIKFHAKDKNKLAEMFSSANKDYQKQITNCLIELKAEDELFAIYKSTVFNNDIFSFLLNNYTSLDSLNNLFKGTSEKFAYLKVANKILDFVINDNFNNIWNFIYELSRKAAFTDQDYKLKILEVLSYIDKLDNISLSVSKHFDDLWYKLTQYKLDKYQMYLLYCLCPKKFHTKIKTYSQDYIISYDIEKSKTEIKKAYLHLINAAVNKSEVETILQNQEIELKRIVKADFYNQLLDIVGLPKDEQQYCYKIKTDEQKKKTDKLLFKQQITIVKDKEAYINQLTDKHQIALSNLTDANQIMRIKDQHRSNLSLVVGFNEFYQILDSMDHNDLSNDEVINDLCRIVENCNDSVIIKKVLDISAKSESVKWLKLQKLCSEYNGVDFYILKTIQNKVSSLNLIWLLKNLKAKNKQNFLNKFVTSQFSIADIKCADDGIVVLSNEISIISCDDDALLYR